MGRVKGSVLLFIDSFLLTHGAVVMASSQSVEVRAIAEMAWLYSSVLGRLLCSFVSVLSKTILPDHSLLLTIF